MKHLHPLHVLKKCKTDITDTQENQWIEQACKRLACCDVYYSCHVDKLELGFEINKKLRYLVHGFTPVNERILHQPYLCSRPDGRKGR